MEFAIFQEMPNPETWTLAQGSKAGPLVCMHWGLASGLPHLQALSNVLESIIIDDVTLLISDDTHYVKSMF